MALTQDTLHDSRIIIDHVTPQLDGGRYPIKREVGATLRVEADIFRDGHDVLAAALMFRTVARDTWAEVPMRFVDNDRWAGEFPLTENAVYCYVVEAWVDEFESWRREVQKKFEAQQDVKSELLEGLRLIEQAAGRAAGVDRDMLSAALAHLQNTSSQAHAVPLVLADDLARLMHKYPDRGKATRLEPELEVVVDRVAARFAAWYEFFPRSQTDSPLRSGTFRDCIQRLPEIAKLGFDVVYLPPIHPIGRSFRKGKNNSLTPGPTDPGSPWAIGNELGGHIAIEPSLGTLADFRAFVAAAKSHGIEVALDFAIQCSPDHPYVREHPEWFYHRPDGTIKYAENPPKKYQDIYPVNFDCTAWQSLWEEMKSIVLYWIEQGVTTFRVDNPHTKPVRFWEWLIREVKREHPEAIFLAEAFTRPKMMKVLAKSGFTQSYTYFTWRNAKQELTEYLTELTQTEMAEYFRGNFFANTPDILHAYLQKGGRPAFKIRFLLGATLASVYGIYSGYELCENVPLHEGSEEYLDSEKYEIRPRNWHAPGNINEFITRVNRARREHKALHLSKNLRFHPTTHDQILCYSKSTPDFRSTVIVVVNLDPHHAHDGNIHLHLNELGLPRDAWFEVHDQISGETYTWRGPHSYVRLDPHREPGHLLVVRR